MSLTGGKFFSIGVASQRIGVMVAMFRRRADEMKLAPSFEIDSVPYFTAGQVSDVEASFAAGVAYSMTVPAAAAMTPQKRAAFEAVVEDLMNNPPGMIDPDHVVRAGMRRR